MNKIGLENVLARFKELAKLTDEEASAYTPTVKSAKAYFERLLLREPTEGDEVSLCEYACAAKAFFDYTVLIAAIPTTAAGLTGGVFTKISQNATVINAERVMKAAFSALPVGLIRDDGFVFECTEG